MLACGMCTMVSQITKMKVVKFHAGIFCDFHEIRIVPACGNVNVYVFLSQATDVAARGIDVPETDLVIQGTYVCTSLL